MIDKSMTVSLSNGQDKGELSPKGSVQNATSPHRIQDGVSPDYATASSTQNVEEAVWFLMRVAYGREKKAKDYLEAKGIETFLPMQTQTYIYKGKKRHRQVSLIPNFLFVKSTEDEMKKYVGKEPLEFFHHYYVPNKDLDGKAIGKKGLKPLVIPSKQMTYFIMWNSVDDDCKLFVSDDKIPLSKNERVKIIDGKFAGLEGHVYRIKGQSRVGIVIDGVGTVFTAYVPKSCLEKINTSSL